MAEEKAQFARMRPPYRPPSRTACTTDYRDTGTGILKRMDGPAWRSVNVSPNQPAVDLHQWALGRIGVM